MMSASDHRVSKSCLVEKQLAPCSHPSMESEESMYHVAISADKKH